MKGLWIKDLKLIGQQKTTMIVIILVGMFLTIQGATSSYAIGYISILSFTLTMGTISYDEFDHGMSFLLTLPVSRKLYVGEKYLLGLAGAVVALLAAVLMAFAAGTIKGTGISIIETLGESYAMLCFTLIMMAVILPLKLKYGPEKERIILLTMVATVFGVMYALSRIKTYFYPDLNIDEMLIGFLQVWGNAVLLLPFLLVLAFVGISYQISLRIMERKEF